MQEEMLLKFKERLTEQRKKLIQQVEFMNSHGLSISLGDSIGELSAYDNHPADIGTEVFERSKDFALREGSLITTIAVDNALEKIEKGTYGKCDTCGRKIALERLEAVPYTTLCMECKVAQEKIPRGDDRPVEEDVLGVPFARSFTDNSENVEYDGEDAWQEVARFSESKDERSGRGSYYVNSNFDKEDRGAVEDVDNIPCEVGADGVIYKDFRGVDDEVVNPVASD